MASFVPTILNQAGQNALKQSMQGVTLSNVTPAPQDPAAQYKAAANAYTASHWMNGTANGQTPAQNLAAVINQPGNPVAANPTPFISNTLNQAAKDSQQVPKPQGTFNPPSAAGDNPVPSMPVAASQSTPAPMSQGSYPGQLTNAQITAEAQARIDKQRAAITEATNAANAARKNVFDYTNQITGDNRTLENGAFNETHNPFTGQTGYAQAQLQRNRSIQDTANNNNYQADITANNQKVTDFETLAPEQQQAIMDGLTRQERDYGLQVGTLTGQFNGQNTMQQNQNNFNNGIALGNLTGSYTGPVGSQGQGMMSAQSIPTSTGGNNTGWQGQGVPTLAAQGQAFNQNLQTNQFNQQAQNQGFNQNMQTQQFAYTQARDAIKDKQYQQQFDMDNQKYGLDYALKQATLNNQITNDQAQRAIGYMNANISQQQANTSAANSAANISNLTADNQRQQAEFDQKQKDTNYQKSFDNLKSLYTAKDQYTGAISVTNPQQLRAAILAKNLSDDETIQMLSDFGLPIKQ